MTCDLSEFTETVLNICHKILENVLVTIATTIVVRVIKIDLPSVIIKKRLEKFEAACDDIAS